MIKKLTGGFYPPFAVREDIYMKYKSKTDLWFHTLTLCFAFFTIYFIYKTLEGDGAYALYSLIFFFALVLFILPVYFNTCYLFTDDALIIRSGIFTKKSISYSNIVSYREGTERTDSAALSKDRIVITYVTPSGRKSILVSPRDKFDFLTQLKISTQNNSGT